MLAYIVRLFWRGCRFYEVNWREYARLRRSRP